MYDFAPVKARCLVYGDCSDAIRLTFCEFIINHIAELRPFFAVTIGRRSLFFANRVNFGVRGSADMATQQIQLH
jgi:hypothetical protein